MCSMRYDLYCTVCKIIDADRHNLILFDVRLWSSLYLMDEARPGVTPVIMGLSLSDNDSDIYNDSDKDDTDLEDRRWRDSTDPQPSPPHSSYPPA